MFGWFRFKTEKEVEPSTGHEIRSGAVDSARYPAIDFAMQVTDGKDGSKTTILQTKDGSMATVRDVPNVGRVVSLDLTQENGIHTPLAASQKSRDRQDVIDQCRDFDRRLD
jgi:hypothetical protein